MLVIQSQLQLKLELCGDTGNVTGIHLHLELSSVDYWDSSYTYFLNPETYLGIPSQRGTIVKYDGSVPPTPPTPTTNKNSKKWLWSKNISIRWR